MPTTRKPRSSLSDHVPAARQIETWFYAHTAAGALVRDAAKALKAAGAEQTTWYYMLPATQA